MQVTETETDGLRREYKVVIAASDIADKMKHRLEELGRDVKLPGFRPGKVPIQILKQRFGASVMGEVVERAVNDSSSQAINERGLRPAMRPKIEITAFDEGKDLEYTMAVEILPEISMMDFGDLEVERFVIDVDDKEVEQALERLAESQKETKPLDKLRKAKSGDVLVVDFRGTVDGEEFPGMAGEGHHLELGANRFVEGFEDQLIGADAGEDRTVTVTFPEGYANDQLSGKEAVFAVKVNEILQSVPRAIDDELAKAFGAEDLAGLKDRVRDQIRQDYEQFGRARMKRKLLDQLAEGHDFPVPPGMTEAEFEAIWKQLEEDREQGRLDPEDADKDEDTLKAEYKAIAERRVRLGLLLNEVGRLNDIDVSQDEMNRALMAEAQRHPGHEREVFEFYQKTPEAQANLRAPIFEDKVIDFIVALAKVTERTVTAEELAALDADENAAAPKKKAAAKKKAPAKKPAGTKGKGTAKGAKAAGDE